MRRHLLLQDLLLIVLLVLAVEAKASGPAKSGVTAQVWARSIIAQMTMEEKTDFLCGSSCPLNDALKASASTKEISRLGVRPMVTSDGPAGLRILTLRPTDIKTYYTTAFPIGTSLASTWDVNMVGKIGEAFGQELKEYGVDILLGPGVNIHRSPLCGRNFEYYSEDPYVTGNIAAAMINGVQSNGVGTSIKHFAANNQETNRHSINEIISERTMREIYLRGFEIAIKKSHPWTVMSSYNKVDGSFTCERHDLLTDILRNEWGYKGFVMSDWDGGVTGNNRSDVVAQISSGNDLLMPGYDEQREDLLKAMKSGQLKMTDVDRALEHILSIVYMSPAQNKYVFSNNPDLKAHAELTRRVGAEGMVLLENRNDALPLSKSSKVALFGSTSYAPITGGLGSGDVYKAYVATVDKGLKNEGIMLDSNLADYYAAYLCYPYHTSQDYNYINEDQMDFNADCLNALAVANDEAVITLGRISGEGSDRKIDDDFKLKPFERKMVENVSKAFHAEGKKVVVVLNIGGVIEMESWKNEVDAILLAWQPGQEVGNSIADVLTGKVNPSGKLTMTFPKKYEDTPAAKYFPGEPANDPKVSYYKEGIYVGYRAYDKQNVEPSYEFGYGKSYTDFKYSDLKLSGNHFSKQFSVSVVVTNVGKYAGKEVAQLYLSAPAANLDKPVKELKGFAKTGLLQPGESETLTMILLPKDLASFYTNQEAWIADKGEYKVLIGASSRDIRLQDKFVLPKRMLVEKVHPAFEK